MFIALLVYLDDILVIGNNNPKIQQVKDFLHSEFTIKDLGAADYFLGIQIMSSIHGLAIS